MSLDNPIPMKDPILIDIYTAVYSETLKRGLKSGEQDVRVPALEAEPWLGNYALLSSERVEEEEEPVASRPAKAPRRSASPKRNKNARSGDGDVGD